MISTITHNETLDTIPEEFFLKYPALKLIGNTDFVELAVFSDEQPGVKISAKAEWLNPGGSVKDRPVLRMIAMAMLSGELKEGQIILDSSSGIFDDRRHSRVWGGDSGSGKRKQGTN